MKILLLVAATLSIIHALSTPFIGPGPFHQNALTPRGKTDPTVPHRGSARGGPNRDGIGKEKDWTKDDADQADRVMQKGKKENYPKGKQFRSSKKLGKDETFYTYDPKTNVAKLYYGSDCQLTSDHLAYRHAHDPNEANRMWAPRPSTPEGRQATKAQRKENQRGVGSKKGIVGEEKPAAGVIKHDGEQSSLIWDTEVSQTIEGVMAKQAYDLVRAGGYDKNNVWQGKGGVMFLPNAKIVNKDKPIIGWRVPGWPDPKWIMSESDSTTAAGRKREKSSDSGSASDDDTLLSKPGSKPPKKSQKGKGKQNAGSKIKRDGVDTIANTEETATTPGSGSNSSNINTQDELQPYLSAWDIVQSNATDVLWPFLEDMLQGTNSSLVYLAAWSVYSDMLAIPTSMIGPFYHGWTSMAWDEQQWANDSSISNDTLQEMYEINDILLDLYDTAWINGLAALNASGLLDDLDFLTTTILAYNESLPTSWTSVNESESQYEPYLDYFLSFNSTVPEDEIIIPSTATGYALVSGTVMPLAAFASAWGSGGPFSNDTARNGTGAMPTGSAAMPTSSAVPSGAAS